MSDWSPAEDYQPGIQLTRTQPELTSKGYVWTQIVVVNWPAPGITQMTIREVGGQYLIGHGRVYPIGGGEEDGA